MFKFNVRCHKLCKEKTFNKLEINNAISKIGVPFNSI